MKNNKLFLYFMAVILFILDQITKFLVLDKLKGYESFVVINNILSFTYVENRGAAWGVLSGKINILVIITIIIIPILLIAIKNTSIAITYTHNKNAFYLLQIILVMIMSGAVGNLADRIYRGFVVDFIQVTFIDFPVFNVADCFITVGAVLFVIDYVFFIKEEEFDIVLKGKKAINKNEGA